MTKNGKIALDLASLALGTVSVFSKNKAIKAVTGLSALGAMLYNFSDDLNEACKPKEIQDITEDELGMSKEEFNEVFNSNLDDCVSSEDYIKIVEDDFNYCMRQLPSEVKFESPDDSTKVVGMSVYVPLSFKEYTEVAEKGNYKFKLGWEYIGETEYRVIYVDKETFDEVCINKGVSLDKPIKSTTDSTSLNFCADECILCDDWCDNYTDCVKSPRMNIKYDSFGNSPFTFCDIIEAECSTDCESYAHCCRPPRQARAMLEDDIECISDIDEIEEDIDYILDTDEIEEEDIDYILDTDEDDEEDIDYILDTDEEDMDYIPDTDEDNEFVEEELYDEVYSDSSENEGIGGILENGDTPEFEGITDTTLNNEYEYLDEEVNYLKDEEVDLGDNEDIFEDGESDYFEDEEDLGDTINDEESDYSEYDEEIFEDEDLGVTINNEDEEAIFEDGESDYFEDEEDFGNIVNNELNEDGDLEGLLEWEDIDFSNNDVCDTCAFSECDGLYCNNCESAKVDIAKKVRHSKVYSRKDNQINLLYTGVEWFKNAKNKYPFLVGYHASFICNITVLKDDFGFEEAKAIVYHPVVVDYTEMEKNSVSPFVPTEAINTWGTATNLNKRFKHSVWYLSEQGELKLNAVKLGDNYYAWEEVSYGDIQMAESATAVLIPYESLKNAIAGDLHRIFHFVCEETSQESQE